MLANDPRGSLASIRGAEPDALLPDPPWEAPERLELGALPAALELLRLLGRLALGRAAPGAPVRDPLRRFASALERDEVRGAPGRRGAVTASFSPNFRLRHTRTAPRVA
ncbi:hypothetical protein [Demequina sediminicola]|uniref:hypothetical protein n=1 Tax=Demequina sediminicola TaxID=1095026 RepID=UPI000AA44567|nr:hypothetical protein [Demequina sediminicola]